MECVWRRLLLTAAIIFVSAGVSWSFNVGTSGAKIFSGPANEEFGYAVQQAENYEGKWLLVTSPWSGSAPNRNGDAYKCPLSKSTNSCDKLNLHDSDSVHIPDVKNLKDDMCLGLTLTRTHTADQFLLCAPLWGQRCADLNYYPGLCTKLSPMFQPQPAFSPALQTCGGPMDIVIVLDGSNSIYPWEPMNAFLLKLVPALDIGPKNTQVSVLQYGVDVRFEMRLNQHQTKDEVINAVSSITQMYGSSTNTFRAIQYASQWGFHQSNGGRAGAAKVMVVVTDGESHDVSSRDSVIAECERQGILRFGIAVLGYYNRNNKNTDNLVKEIKSIASSPVSKYFFNVSEEAALSNIAGTLGSRIFSIEGTGKGGDSFQMEMSQVGFSAHSSSRQDLLVLGAVGAFSWSGTVVHQSGSNVHVVPFSAFEGILQDKNHSSLLGYSVSILSDGDSEYFVAGAPRSNHSGQVIVYSVSDGKQTTVIDSERGKQIGSYFGSVLCSLDVDGDGVTDLLLVSAPMFMSSVKREEGRVYVFSVTKGILNEQGVLRGAPPAHNARFGAALSSCDLDRDGSTDLLVGAPLEDEGTGAVYVFNGDGRTLSKHFSQRISGSKLDPGLQFFGRSLDSLKDLNDDSLPDVTVGAYGKVVQLWSRGVAVVSAKASFTPEKINVFNKPCDVNGRKLSCFIVRVCLNAAFRPQNPVGPLDVWYSVTLDADLQASRVLSRGLFMKNNERFLKEKLQISAAGTCRDLDVYVQEAPDFVNSISLKVELEQDDEDANPVLDPTSPSAWDFFVPFTKDCGSDEVCSSDLVLTVKTQTKKLERVEAAALTLPPPPLVVVSSSSREIWFSVLVKNVKENAYNARVSVTFSKNLYYSSTSSSTDEVKCSSSHVQVVTCQVGYPALKSQQQVKFQMNFDYNLDQLQDHLSVKFEALSDSLEEQPGDNVLEKRFGVKYDAGIVLSRTSNINFFVADAAAPLVTNVKSLDDIGPEFNFTVKISSTFLPIKLLYVNIDLPLATKGGNPLLYVSSITHTDGAVTCDPGLLDRLQVGVKEREVSFREETLRGTDQLDCRTAQCESMKCLLKDLAVKSESFITVKTRIWSGTFIKAKYQTLEVVSSVSITTSDPNLLVNDVSTLQVPLAVTKPGEKSEVPVGVIAGSVVGGLVLLGLAVGLLWKFGFFKRKYQQLQRDADDDDAQSRAHVDEVL